MGFPHLNLIEKDMTLHKILLLLSEEKNFYENYIFKGGTCLIKTYLGYYRFSEDLDFTWKDQTIFDGLSSKKRRRVLSSMINGLGDHLEEICKAIGLEFRCDKGDRNFVEIGGSNKIVTYKLWFNSSFSSNPTFVTSSPP